MSACAAGGAGSTACSVTTPEGPGKSPASPEWQQHQQDVRKLTQYQTRGAFVIPRDQQKVYARSSGNNRSGQLSSTATNPLGSTELELTASRGTCQMTDNKGQHYTANDAKR
ncbi:lipoprotein insertase outer membrane protein LolB [Shigella flexneri]